MRCIVVPIRILAILVVITAPAAAQTISIVDPDSARAGVRVGYGGHGIDLDASVDSRRFAGLVRFRADVGHGAWVGINSEGNEPPVTRLAAAALLYFAPRDRPGLPAYVGIGIGAFLPHGEEFTTRTGTRLILGMEVSGDGWTVGPEIEFDLTRGRLDRFVRSDLLPTLRAGVAVRRHF